MFFFKENESEMNIPYSNSSEERAEWAELGTSAQNNDGGEKKKASGDMRQQTLSAGC